MLNAPNIDPVAIQIGWLKVHWYGLMYLVGFAAGWALGVYRAKRPGSGWKPAEVGDLLFYIALGVILGGRVGHVLFYDFAAYLAEPLQIFYIWRGGMSFHGGLVGVIVALWLYGKHTQRTFFMVADFAVPLGPIGLGLGRLGNFINHELWGRVTDVPWGMVFFRNPEAGPLPRHPTQLYEFFLEGAVLFLILWFYSARPRPAGAVSGLFLICYGVFRFTVEFVRVPDRQLGYLAFGWVTMGQLLSVPMILAGVGLMVWAYRRRPAGA